MAKKGKSVKNTIRQFCPSPPHPEKIIECTALDNIGSITSRLLFLYDMCSVVSKVRGGHVDPINHIVAV
jgi:hypothetical protein